MRVIIDNEQVFRCSNQLTNTQSATRGENEREDRWPSKLRSALDFRKYNFTQVPDPLARLFRDNLEDGCAGDTLLAGHFNAGDFNAGDFNAG